jgi:protein-L-isoaspartate(D-aspartate) O-methyltransferase
LTDQLAEKGIMAIPVGGSGLQELHIIRRQQGNLEITLAGGCSFVPLVYSKTS